MTEERNHFDMRTDLVVHRLLTILRPEWDSIAYTSLISALEQLIIKAVQENNREDLKEIRNLIKKKMEDVNKHLNDKIRRGEKGRL